VEDFQAALRRRTKGRIAEIKARLAQIEVQLADYRRGKEDPPQYDPAGYDGQRPDYAVRYRVDDAGFVVRERERLRTPEYAAERLPKRVDFDALLRDNRLEARRLMGELEDLELVLKRLK
jgi:hypothetical protein